MENIPPLAQYQQMTDCRVVQQDEINNIAQLTGNHWRKVFNVYAKLVYQLEQHKQPSDLTNKFLTKYPRWQDFRDNELLQQPSEQCLLFSPPECNTMPAHTVNDSHTTTSTIKIIMGRTYAKSLADKGYISIEEFVWLSAEFAVNNANNFIICPYFDYRQLSNVKIETLAQLIQSLAVKETL